MEIWHGYLTGHDVKITEGIVEPLWGCMAGLQEAYFHVVMGWTFHKYLDFKDDDRVLVFHFMPFGLSSAPWAFHRVIPTREGLVHNTDHVLNSFKRLGLSEQCKVVSNTLSGGSVSGCPTPFGQADYGDSGWCGSEDCIFVQRDPVAVSSAPSLLGKSLAF